VRRDRRSVATVCLHRQLVHVAQLGRQADTGAAGDVEVKRSTCGFYHGDTEARRRGGGRMRTVLQADRGRRRNHVTSHPGGMKAISRWLSAATPPVSRPLTSPHPGGMPGTRARHCDSPVIMQGDRDSDATIQRETSGIPPGCEALHCCISGGVAALNHRLMAVTPPGSGVGRQCFTACRRVAFRSAKGRSFAERKTTHLCPSPTYLVSHPS
jgi:hypothetical protein